MQARLQTSAPRYLVGGVFLVGFWLGIAASLYAIDPNPLAGDADAPDRGATLVGTLNEAFPTLGPQLGLSSSFEDATWSHGDDRIQGLRPRRAPVPDKEPPVDVVFPVRASDPVVVEADGVRVALRPRGAASVPARILDGKLAYLNVYEETDSIHIVEERWTEEYLYLRTTDAPVRFEYDLVEARGVSSIEVENGQVSFLDADDEGLVILPPFVVDAAGRHSATAARWELADEAEPEARRRLVLRLDPAGLDYPLVVDPTWIRTRDLGPARQDGIGILLHNNKVLVMGANPQAALYDIATGTWSPTGPGWPGRSLYAAVMLRDGRVLATGGSDAGAFADCHLYDPATNTWTPADSMSVARVSHTATLLDDGTVLVAGGEGTLASAEIYDPAGDSWSNTGSMNNGKAQHTATKLPDGRVVVIGGVTGVGIETGITEIYAGGTWTEVAPMVPARTRHSATLLRDGRILVVGGGLIPTTTAQIYNPPPADTWVGTPNLSVARAEHSATMLPSGRVVVVGGDNFGELASVEVYDGATWTPIANLNFARYRHAATMLSDGRVLVVGGFGPGALVTAELLDVDAPAFVDHNAMQIDRSEHTMTPLRDGRVLAAGGVGLASAELYNPASGNWAVTAFPMNQPRWRHTATRMLGGRVLVAGSASAVPGAAQSAEVYDPAGDTWSLTPPMSAERAWHTATLLPCGEVLVVGGETTLGTGLATAERYNPRLDDWTGTGPMAGPRRRHTATLLLDGRVLVTGGWDGGPLNTAETYNPVTGMWTLLANSMTVPREFHRATLLPSGKVLIVGGVGSGTSAELFDPAGNTFTAIPYPVAPARDSYFTATLLRNGRVLVAGGSPSPSTAVVYDPAADPVTTDPWLPLPALQTPRERHAAAVLPDGHVLISGGPGPIPDVEYFDVGRGELSAWRPAVIGVTDPAVEDTPFVAIGAGFAGLGEGSTGQGHMHSATNYPLVQLHRLDNDAVRWLPLRLPPVASGGQWTPADFNSDPAAVNGFAPGPARVTVFANGIPSDSTFINVECLPPNVTTNPVSQNVCVGDSVNFFVAATGPCVVYQWRKDTAALVDGPVFSGTRTDTLDITNVNVTEAGSYDAIAQLSCSATTDISLPATLTVSPNLSSVSVAPLGPFSVCTTCLGPTLTVSETGGGAPSRQWGYRLMPAGAVFDIPGQTGPSYILNGSDLPGVGTYYIVETTTPTCGSPLVSLNEVEVTVTTATPADDVEFFTVTSRNTENVLEWVNPAGYNTVSIHATSGPTCIPPTDPLNLGTWIADEPGVAGMRDSYLHSPLPFDTTYCYTLFVDTGGGTYSAGRSNRGRTMSPGPVQWAFSTGVFSLTAPTVGGAGVIATSNDHVVHAMTRGAAPPGGEWPAAWLPKPLGGPVQSRSPIVPIDVGPLPSNPVVYIGSQDGNVYVVDGARGGAVADPWAPVPLGGLPGQAAPAGMFSAWGTYDHLLVGTRLMGGDNRFYAIDPLNGGPPTDFFDNLSGTGAIGMINAMAAVDYGNDRVYFTSFRNGLGSQATLWCLDLISQTTPVFSLRWEENLDDIASSPVLMGGRVYVGSIRSGGRVLSVNADSGGSYFFDHFDGQVKEFIWPDWRNPGDLYFATDSLVWALHDDGATIGYKAPVTAPVSLAPAIPTSAVLQVAATDFVYVGADDGRLYEIDFSQDPPIVKSVQLGDGGAAVGSPSLDWPNDLIHVGTEAGVFYAVDIPLP